MEDKYIKAILEACSRAGIGVILLEEGAVKAVNDFASEIMKEHKLEEIKLNFDVLHEEDDLILFRAKKSDRDNFLAIYKGSSDILQELEEILRIIDSGVSIIEQVASSSEQTERELVNDLNLVRELIEESKGISRILLFINEVSEQTSLLSLNATIEAARVGEACRGFAVVAEEIGKLASKTMEFTKEISSVLKRIEKSIEIISSHIEKAVSLAKEQRDFSSDAEMLFYLIKDRADDLKDKYHKLNDRIAQLQ
jgi:methyl-accepting chemotaxis protein